MTADPIIKRWLRRLIEQAERGTTATGYALVVATLVAASLAAIQTLQTNSGDFLAETGSEVGTPRLPREQAVTSLLPPPPVYAPPTAPLTIITFDDEAITVPDLGASMCMDLAAGNIVSWAPCGTSPNEISLTASFNSPNITLSLGGGQCLGADVTNVLVAVPCSGGPAQLWVQIDVIDGMGAVEDDKVSYELDGTGLCIKAVNTPPAVQGDPGFVLGPCATASVLEISI